MSKKSYIELRIRPLALLTSALRLGTAVATADAASAATSAIEVGKSLGIEKDEQDILARLLAQALIRASSKIIEQSFSHPRRYDLLRAARVNLSSIEIDGQWTIEGLKQIDTLGLPKKICDSLVKCLEQINLSESDAKNIVSRISGNLPEALHEEWISQPELYNSLRELAKSPFQSIITKNFEWDVYRSNLYSRVHQNVFDETFSLNDIFVETPAYFSSNEKNSNESLQNLDLIKSNKKIVVKIIEELEGFVEDKIDLSFVAISGGPGTGKSSLSTVFAARLGRQGYKVLLLQLHLLDVGRSFGDAVRTYFSDTRFFRSHDPLQEGDVGSPLIIILDGLDELQMQGRAAQESVKDFVANAVRWLDRKNSGQKSIAKIIFTGRDLAVQAANPAFRGDGRVYHLLPYYVPEQERKKYENPSILGKDLRLKWWNNYARLTGRPEVGMPSALDAGELREVTSQPLLNYLVSLAYYRGKIDISQVSVNAIYADLLSAIHERVWSSRRHPSSDGLDFDSFVRLLEEVAVSVWHGAGRTATLSEVEEHCRESGIANLFPQFQSGLSEGISNLLLAFYFRQSGLREDGQKTFEFTHKSFAEYLIGLAIVRLIKSTCDKVRRNKVDFDDGWNLDEAAFRWLKLSGPTLIDLDIVAFVRREIEGFELGFSNDAQDIFVELIQKWSRNTVRMDRIEGLEFSKKNLRYRNSATAVLGVLNCLAQRNAKISRINWSDRTEAGDFLRKLAGQRHGPIGHVSFGFLSFIDFTNCIFDMSDFYGANLRGSIFDGAALHYTNFATADLTGASFDEAYFLCTNFVGSSLNDVRFKFWDHMIERGMIMLRNSQGHASLPRDKERIANWLRRSGAEVVILPG